MLIHEEVFGRDGATRRMRRRTANFPTGKTLGSWQPEQSSIPEPTQQALATLEWIGRRENLVIAGPSGSGKSHFVEGLSHAAIEQDLRVAWFTLESLTATASIPEHPAPTTEPSCVSYRASPVLIAAVIWLR